MKGRENKGLLYFNDFRTVVRVALQVTPRLISDVSLRL